MLEDLAFTQAMSRALMGDLTADGVIVWCFGTRGYQLIEQHCLIPDVPWTDVVEFYGTWKSGAAVQ